MHVRRSKWLSNSKAFYFSDNLKKFILINKTFKIVGNVLKIKKEEKYFIKYFFLDSCILNKTLNETSKDILFFCKYEISLALIFFNLAHIYTSQESLRIRGIYYLRLISY